MYTKIASADINEYVGKTDALLTALEETKVLFSIVDAKTTKPYYTNTSVLFTLGYSKEDIQTLGTDWIRSITHPDDLPNLAKFVEQYTKFPAMHISHQQYRMKAKTGMWRMIDTVILSLGADLNGYADKLVVVTKDVTELVEKHAQDGVKIPQEHRCRICDKLLGMDSNSQAEIIIKCIRCGEFNPLSKH